MTINIECKVLIEVHDRFSISDHCNRLQLKNTRSFKMDPNRIGTNALKQYRMITSGITITSTAREKCSTLPSDNILIYPRSANIETCPNELYTLNIFLIQNRSSRKSITVYSTVETYAQRNGKMYMHNALRKYTCIFYKTLILGSFPRSFMLI